MRKLFWLLMLAFVLPEFALAATVTVNDSQCSAFAATPAPNGGLEISCSTGGANPPPTPPAPPQAPTPADACTAQGLRNTVASFDWGGGYLKRFQMSGGESLSFPISANAGDFGKITTVYGGTSKIISISTQKCDFSQALITKNCLGGGSDPVISYIAGSSRFLCALTPGLTYYVNIRNAVLNGAMPVYPIQDSCVGQCAFQIAY